MSSYTGTNISDLDVTTPTESTAPPSELNNSDREIKTVLKNQYAITSHTSGVTLGDAHHFVLCNATGGAFNVTLPTASDIATSAYEKEYILFKTDSSANAVTVVGTVSGVTNPTLTQKNQIMIIRCDGTSYYDATPGNPVKTVSTAVDLTLRADQCYGSIIEVSAAKTVTAPAGVGGMNLILRASAAVAISFDPNGSEVITLNGVALTGGHKVTSTGAINDSAAFYHNGTAWVIPGYTAWTDGG